MSAPAGARLVLATHNRGKLVELMTILRAQPELSDLPDDAVVSAADLGALAPVEDGVTFEQNALIKARALCAATGLPAVADDSGLAVDVLGGAPGIFSARWAGRHGDDAANLEVLLGQLAEITDPAHRRAGFVCAAALVTPDGREVVEHGEMRGVLALEPRGTGGFGYDPILIPDDDAGRVQRRLTGSGEAKSGVPASSRREARRLVGWNEVVDERNEEHDASSSSSSLALLPVTTIRPTSAELTPEVKNAISHRGKAFRALAPAIAAAIRCAPDGAGCPGL